MEKYFLEIPNIVLNPNLLVHLPGNTKAAHEFIRGYAK